MRKIRSKLKRKSTNQKWKRGHSSTSNPTKTIHRDKARARFLNANLNSGLTTEAVNKLNKLSSEKTLINHATIKKDTESMESESMYSVAQTTTVRSFMSSFSTHTNASFNKLLDCDTLNKRQKEMVAVLAASTETIKEKEGGETSTEYYLAFINSLAIIDELDRADPIIGLLALVIKAVPKAIMQEKFTLARDVFLKLIEMFEKNEKQAALIDTILNTGYLLSAQEFSKWNTHGCLSLLKAILSFTTHSKPKIRKAAVKAITGLLKTCSTLMESTDAQHPASQKVAEYCLEFFTSTHLNSNSISVLHILGLIEHCFGFLQVNDVKSLCEGLLSLSTASNPLVRMHCYQALYTLFEAETNSLSDIMAGKLIAAVFDLQPDTSDVRQTIAWLTVLKKGYISLVRKSLQLCGDMIPRFMKICIEDLWPSNQKEISSTVAAIIKEILIDVISPLCSHEPCRRSLMGILNNFNTILKNPFAQCHKQVIIMFSTIYEVFGKEFGTESKDSLIVFASSYDPNGTNRREIENTVLSAIKYIDIAIVLSAIPLADAKGEISIERSWMLPLLREGLRSSSLEYFYKSILPMASSCLKKWKDLESEDKASEAHIYELLCCQLWGLFPGFCRQPKDVEKFTLIAKTAGIILNENLYLRAPILDGFKELIPSVISANKTQYISQYSKNYLPILFNLYINKPKGSYENDLRLNILDIIKLFLKITPNEVLNQIFNNALTRLKNTKQGEFAYNMLFDIVECFVAYLKSEELKTLYNEYVKPMLTTASISKKDAKNVQPQVKKAYRILCSILEAANDNSLQFLAENMEDIEKLILSSEQLNGDNVMFTRLRCLKYIIQQPTVSADSDLIRQSISEMVLCYPNQPEKPNQLCTEMVKIIGLQFKTAGKLDEFVELLCVGIASESIDLIVKTIWAINSVLVEFTNEMEEESLNFLIENIFASVQNNHRMEAKAALCTLYTYIKHALRSHLTTNLEMLVKSVSKMVPDTKRFCRLAYGRLLKKLCRYYSVQEIVRLVPGNDLVTHKRLKKIRKELNKSKNSKNSTDNIDDSSDDENEIDKKFKTITIDDVLKDSDSSDLNESDLEDEQTSKKKTEKKLHKAEVCIREDVDTIVDLTDMNAISKISLKNKKKKRETNMGNEDDEKITFKTAADGRLLIEEPKKNRKEFFKGVKRSKGSDTESSESENDDDGATKMEPKKKRSKGIHRNVSSATSVVSGRSGKTFKSNSTSVMSKKSKKQHGGEKQKMQPFAYLPLRKKNKTK